MMRRSRPWGDSRHGVGAGVAGAPRSFCRGAVPQPHGSKPQLSSSQNISRGHHLLTRPSSGLPGSEHMTLR